MLIEKIIKSLKTVSLDFSPKNESIGKNIKKIALHEFIKKNKNVHQKIKSKYIIIGVPDDRGVIANQGNPGAKHGPAHFRKSFYSLYDTKIRKKNFNNIFFSELLIDAGDIILSKSIKETHNTLAHVVEFFLKHEARLIFVIGGGHDFSYGSYKGHCAVMQNQLIPIVNIDAHFDLRSFENDNVNSGTAFKRIIQNHSHQIANGKALLEIGIQRERNPYSLYEFVQENSIPTIEYIPFSKAWQNLQTKLINSPLEHIRDHIDNCAALGFNRYEGSLHLSLCLDVFDQSFAPGTSASTPFGVKLNELKETFTFFGKSKTCRVMDIAELCPARDTLEMTSRLCATLVYRLALLREECSHR